MTKVTAGSTTQVDWTGSAVHGGGSCQFLVNYGETYTDDPADWKVVYTIIGGCPASAVGNIETQGTDAEGRPDGPHCGNDSGTECVRQFDIPIPKGMKNGKATFAWTWFNKIGNREFYMNCAPIEITGGTDDDSFAGSLPSMFVANLPDVPGSNCTTVEGVFNIPNPGSFGRVLEQPDPAASGNCPSAPVPNFAGESAAPAGSGSAIASSAVVSQSSAPVATAAVPAVVVSSIAMQPTTFVTATVATSAAQAPPASTSALSASPVGSAACTDDGEVVCIETGFFGICNHGSAVKQPLAAGTKCVDGKIMRRNVSPRRG